MEFDQTVVKTENCKETKTTLNAEICFSNENSGALNYYSNVLPSENIPQWAYPRNRRKSVHITYDNIQCSICTRMFITNDHKSECEKCIRYLNQNE